MKALVLKDFYVLWKQMRMLVLILVLLSAVGGVFNSVFAVVWCAMMPFTAIAYDERSHWDQLAAMMPYSKWDIVLSKYVLGWLCMAAALVLSLVCQLAASLVNRGTAPELATLVLSFLGGMVSLALMLPMVFRFGVERGRLGFMIIIFGVAILGGISAEMAEELPRILAVLPLTAVVATAVSIPLSMKLYRVN